MTTYKELNSALQWKDPFCPQGQFIFVRDTLLSDGSFLIHHFLNSFLTSDKKVCLATLNQTFFHYQTIQLKLNANLLQEGEKNKFRFIDGLSSVPSVVTPQVSSATSDLFFASPLNAFSQDPVLKTNKPACLSSPAINSAAEAKATTYLDQLLHSITNCFATAEASTLPDLICIDHINPLLALSDDTAEFYQFIRNLVSLTKQKNVTIVVLMHCHSDTTDKRYQIWNPSLEEETTEENRVANMMEHFSDVVFRVQALPSGYSRDVHGMLEVVHTSSVGSEQQQLASFITLPKVKVLHYKIFEHTVKFFSPGGSSRELF